MFKTIFFSLLVAVTAFADMPSVHGMLLFGAKKVYVSHLPMFHAPHDYQMIASLTLPAEIKSLYVADQATSGAEYYTLVPEKFELPTMVKTPKPFKAVLYRGHFER